jgi:hypothetical protein
MPSSSTYLQQFDAQSSLWVWDEELIVESDSGGYVEVRSAFGGDGTIPSPVNADDCKDKDMDMQLPYGPCFICMSGDFNEGFCERFAGWWDSLSEVQGLRGATAIFQVSFVCCACVCARGREKCFEG